MADQEKHLRTWRREGGDDWVVALALGHRNDSYLSLTGDDADQLEDTLRASHTAISPPRVREHEGLLYVASIALGTDNDERALRKVISDVDTGIATTLIPARLALARVEPFSPTLARMLPHIAYENMNSDRREEAQEIFDEFRARAVDRICGLFELELEAAF